MTEKCEMSTHKKSRTGWNSLPCGSPGVQTKVTKLWLLQEAPACHQLRIETESTFIVQTSPKGCSLWGNASSAQWEAAWRSPRSLRKHNPCQQVNYPAGALSCCCSCCSSSPQRVLYWAMQTCGVSGGLGYILRIYFNWNFQTSSGWVRLKIDTSGTANLCVLEAVQLMALPLCRMCFRYSAL